jgi:hypothetical protein
MTFTRFVMGALALAMLPLLAKNATADTVASQPMTWEAESARLLSELAPATKAKLQPAGTMLKPDGRELAECLLRPLAEGRGPLTKQDVLAAVKNATQDQSKLDALLAHRVSLLGGYEEQDLGKNIDWFRAPKGDWQWPTHLSRHYWLRPLAEAWRATKDPRYSGAVVEVLLDWLRRTPLQMPELKWNTRLSIGRGIPATSEGNFQGYPDGPWTSLSAELRFDAWSELLQLIWDAPQLTNANVAPLLHSLARDHRLMMLNHDRSGTANQYMSIAKALVHLNWWFPDFAGSARAEEMGWQRLRNAARVQVYPDGSMSECSPNYAISSLLGLCELVTAGRRQGHAVPDELGAAVVRGTSYFAMLTDPLGRMPRLATAGESARADLAQLNELTHDPAVAFVATGRRAERAPLRTNVIFPWVGYAVFRSGWDEQATWLLFEPGPRGSGHHHLAQLNVQLIANGETLLTDPGFYTYSTVGDEGKMATYLASSAAHNVALVDGEGQIETARGTSRRPNATAGEYYWSESADLVSAHGVYTYGFGNKGIIGVRHSRSIRWFPKSNEFEVCDQFEGRERHRVELRWQCDPQAKVTVAGASATISMPHTALELAMTTAEPLKLKVMQGERNPLGGWFSAG